MCDKTGFGYLVNHLNREIVLARARAEAIDFVIKAKEDLSRNVEEIRLEKENEMELDNNGTNNISSSHDQEYQQIYTTQLQDCLDFINREIQKRGVYNDQITGLLHNKAVPFDAKIDAYQFILDSDFNLELLTKEIRDIEDIITNPPSSLKEAMLPGASPGIYKRSYLEALKKVEHILNEKRAKG